MFGWKMSSIVPNSFHIFTYGCQMNKNDSEIMAGILIHDVGMVECEDPEKASLLIFNTCAVRANAENRALARLREFNGKRKKNKLSQKLVLAGCVPQYEQAEILKKLPFLDFVIGTNTLEYLPQLLAEKTSSSRILLEPNKDASKSAQHVYRESRHHSWIPIMYGCDNYCSYCIVPYTRGRETSRPKEEILKEVEALKDTNYHEVMLLGQNVNSYGKQLYSDYDFADLLAEVAQFEHITMIDFLTSHPKDITDKLIEVIATTPKIGREIHFPLQAGDNEILAQMNRGYTYEAYKALVEKIRSRIPEARIATDIIVGFPGETEEQFQNSIRAIQEIKFHRVISSAYSPRKGTAAASMTNQIDEKTKHRRLLELQAVVKQFAFSHKDKSI